jgi:hypothetical protein
MCYDVSASFRHAAWELEHRPMAGHSWPDTGTAEADDARAERPRTRRGGGRGRRSLVGTRDLAAYAGVVRRRLAPR